MTLPDESSGKLADAELTSEFHFCQSQKLSEYQLFPLPLNPLST